MGLTVFEKMQCQNNTDKQIMMNEGNKCLPPSFITLPTHRGGGGKKCTGGTFFRFFLFCPLLAKSYYYDLFVEHMNYKIGSDIKLEIRYDYKSIYTEVVN